MRQPVKRWFVVITVFATLGAVPVDAQAPPERVSIVLRPAPADQPSQAALLARAATVFQVVFQEYPWIRLAEKFDMSEAVAELWFDIAVESSKGPSSLMNIRARLTRPQPSGPQTRSFTAVFPSTEFAGRIEGLAREIAATFQQPDRSRERLIRILPVCFRLRGGTPKDEFLEQIVVQDITTRLQSGLLEKSMTVLPPALDRSACGSVPREPQPVDLFLTGSLDIAGQALTIRADVRSDRSSVIVSADARGRLSDFGELARQVGGMLATKLAVVASRFQQSGSIQPLVERPGRSVNDLLLEAQRARADGQREEALQAYSEALRLSSKLAEPRLRLAELLREAQDFDGAVRELQLALQANPDLVEAALLLGQTFEEIGRYQQAIAVYERVLLSIPPSSSPGVLRALARDYLFVNRNEEAIRLLTRLAAAIETPPDLRQLLARAYRAARDYDKAIANLHLATRDDPVHREELLKTYAEYAEHLGRQRKLANALALFGSEYRDELNKVAGGPVKGRLLLLEGWLLVEMNRPGDALARLDEGFKVFRALPAPLSGGAVFDVAIMIGRVQLKLAARGQSPENLKFAQEMALAAHSVDRENPVALELLGNIAKQAGDADKAADHYYAAARQYEKLGEEEDALRLYDMSLASDPHVADEQRNPGWRWKPIVGYYGDFCRLADPATVGRFRAWLGAVPETDNNRIDLRMADALALDYAEQDEAAVAAYRQVLEADSKDRDALLGLAIVYQRMGRFDDAVAQFEAAQQAGLRPPGIYFARTGLGEIALQRGRIDEALKHFEKAIESQPKRPRAYLRIAQVHLQTKQTRQAIDTLERAKRLLNRRPARPCQLEAEIAVEVDVALAKAYESEGRLGDGIVHLDEVQGYYATQSRERAAIEGEATRLKAALGQRK